MNFSKVKFFLKLFFVVMMIFISVFPSSYLYYSRNEIFEIHSENKEYKLIAYRLLPVSLYSIYKLINSEGYFFIVYDLCGDVIYKPNFNYGIGSNLIYGGFRFSEGVQPELFFPTNGGVDSVILKKPSLHCIPEKNKFISKG